MADNLETLARLVRSKLQSVRPALPSQAVLHRLLKLAYFATLHTEESRFVSGSLTVADPRNSEPDPPPLRRADYPAFTPFQRRVPLTVTSLVKLSRAIDRWSASIAVYGTRPSNVAAWGLVDQLVQHNMRVNREGFRGFGHPGIISILMEGIGEIGVYRGNLFLGAIRSDRIVTHENDALASEMVAARILPSLIPAASRIPRAVGLSMTADAATTAAFRQWSTSVARLCIGLRRLGTGGAFLLTPRPLGSLLDIAYPFRYTRLRDASILSVLDTAYADFAAQQRRRVSSASIPTDVVIEESLAETDAEDRADELTGAVKVVTSLAAMDGLVLLHPSLAVVGFGVKVKASTPIGKVYSGRDFARRGAHAATVNTSSFGTRHGSVLRYCRADGRAIAVIVSQDGRVRVVATLGRSLVMWEDVKLLDHERDYRGYLRGEQYTHERRASSRKRVSFRHGYTSTPKTLDELMRLSPAL